MLQFEILEHPADIGFRAFGASEAELFENAALALLSIGWELEGIEPLEQYPLSASASDLELLLVNWLNEVLYLTDGKRIAVRQCRVNAINSTHVSGLALGEPRDPDRHRARIVVKAVTYHQLKAARTPAGWLADVYLDI
ncbi:MAG: archease [Acidobacteria bacterium]|nr:archease [Acidobacteriota bacterium]